MTTIISGSYPAVNSDSDATINGLTVGKGGGAGSTNTTVGNGAMAASAPNNEHTAIGNNALANNVSTASNTALGSFALFTNTTGQANVGLGKNTLYFNTSGSYNTATGLQAIQSNTTGANNTAQGYQALFSNTTASNNTAVGYQAGYSNTTGEITAVGVQALYANTTGTQNTAVGVGALYPNTTGGSNSALGRDALNANTTGSNNTAMGQRSLYNNTTASYNTAVGYQAGYTQAGGVGANTFIGYQAGQVVTTGQVNTFVGFAAGNTITTGSKNSIFGAYNGNQGGLDIRTSSNYIVLSDGDGTPQAYFQPSGNLVVTRTTFSSINAIGCYQDTSASAANVFITTGGSFVRSTSSRKYKTDIQDATHGLADVLNLRSVTYKGTGNHDSEQVLGGLIAEEVHDAGLTEFVQYADDGTPDALAYGHMVSLCVKAIQELNAKVEAQALEIATLKAK